MSKIQGNSPVSALEWTDYSMNTAFPSRFRLDFSSPSLFAVACSAFPEKRNPDWPALSNLHVRDRCLAGHSWFMILGLDGQDALNIGYRGFADKMEGDLDSTVRLTISRRGVLQNFEVKRAYLFNQPSSPGG